MRVATDIGGTFTDLVHLDPPRTAAGSAKSPSTPPDFAQRLLDALAKSPCSTRRDRPLRPRHDRRHQRADRAQGRERRLITTAGFRDVLEIGRANRPDLYNLVFRKQPAFVPRDLRFEVGERLDYQGRS